MSTNYPLSFENLTFTPLDTENPIEAWNHVKAATLNQNLAYQAQMGRIQNVVQPVVEQFENLTAPDKDIYTVKSGDSLWQIAKNNNISLDQLLTYNKDKLKGNLNTVIHPGDQLYVPFAQKRYITSWQNLNDVNQYEEQVNKNNLQAIQAAPHENRYAVIDKHNRTFTIYDSNNNIIYRTNKISSGASQDDYNTVTYRRNGDIIDGAGNMSTPAGITVISSRTEAFGHPAFTRARPDENGGIKILEDKKIPDNISSSIHYYPYLDGSNGCVRVGENAIYDLNDYLDVGTKIYTLPEKSGSRFELRDGKLNYFADSPYGIQEGDRKLWDDYNVYSDRSYNPLLIERARIDPGEDDITNVPSFKTKLHNENIFMKAIMDNKEDIQRTFNIDSKTYNMLAQLAMGIAEQETRFNTSYRKSLKDMIPDFMLNIARGNSNRSRGATQIKIKGDNKQMQEIYARYGITEDNLENIYTSAFATLLRLAYMYNSEVKGRSFTGENNIVVSPQDALLYKWMGHNEQLREHTATPELNNYIRNVHNYSQRYNYYTQRKTPVGYNNEYSHNNTASNSSQKYYTVQRGDILGIIAEKYGVSVNDLLSYNKIKNADLIYPGQKIYVSAPPLSK